MAAVEPPLASHAESIQHWIDELNSAEFRQQWQAAYALGTLGPQAAPAVPALHTVLDVKSGKNEYARSMAAWALGRIGPAAEPEIPFLIETMRSTKLLAVRRSTAEALGNFGPAAKPAVSELVKMLRNDDEITCVNAAAALWKIARHPKAMPSLLQMLRQGNPAQAYAAAVVLGQIEKDADAAAPALIEALHAPDADVRRAAARSLGRLGRAAFPALQKSHALQDPDADTRRMVVEALSWMGPEAVPALIVALKDGSPAVRSAAARAWAAGAEARSGRSALETAASDSREDVAPPRPKPFAASRCHDAFVIARCVDAQPAARVNRFPRELPWATTCGSPVVPKTNALAGCGCAAAYNSLEGWSPCVSSLVPIIAGLQRGACLWTCSAAARTTLSISACSAAPPVDYPEISIEVARAVSRGEADRGILIGGMAFGMVITANKFPGVRAVLCHDEVSAEISRGHCDCNLLCLSADLTAHEMLRHIVEVWLATGFEGGRHARRLEKIARLEDETMKK